jgi:hypothetical protein
MLIESSKQAVFVKVISGKAIWPLAKNYTCIYVLVFMKIKEEHF